MSFTSSNIHKQFAAQFQGSYTKLDFPSLSQNCKKRTGKDKILQLFISIKGTQQHTTLIDKQVKLQNNIEKQILDTC